MARGDEYIRGVQLDAVSLRLADGLAERRGCSRSQLIRWLIRDAAAADGQLGLPGLGGDVQVQAVQPVGSRSGSR